MRRLLHTGTGRGYRHLEDLLIIDAHLTEVIAELLQTGWREAREGLHELLG